MQDASNIHDDGTFYGAQGGPDVYECPDGCCQVFGAKAHEMLDDASNVVDVEHADVEVDA